MRTFVGGCSVVGWPLVSFRKSFLMSPAVRDLSSWSVIRHCWTAIVESSSRHHPVQQSPKRYTPAVSACALHEAISVRCLTNLHLSGEYRIKMQKPERTIASRRSVAVVTLTFMPGPKPRNILTGSGIDVCVAFSGGAVAVPPHRASPVHMWRHRQSDPMSRPNPIRPDPNRTKTKSNRPHTTHPKKDRTAWDGTETNGTEPNGIETECCRAAPRDFGATSIVAYYHNLPANKLTVSMYCSAERALSHRRSGSDPGPGFAERVATSSAVPGLCDWTVRGGVFIVFSGTNVRARDGDRQKHGVLECGE